jgi:hypothetical protein
MPGQITTDTPIGCATGALPNVTFTFQIVVAFDTLRGMLSE